MDAKQRETLAKGIERALDVTGIDFIPGDRWNIEDALTPIVDEMIRQAREETWDECAARVGTRAVSPGNYAGPTIFNPYTRKATT